MKHIKIGAVIAILTASMAVAASAQRKTTKKPVPKKPPVAVKLVAPLDVRAAREKTTIQLENVNLWIDKLGPIAEALELLDNAYATKPPRQATLATHETRKKKFVEVLRNLRGDLGLLESEFRTKPALKKYLPSVEGVMDLAAQAEDMAIAGEFVASKQPLRDASKKLTDTLAAMPL